MRAQKQWRTSAIIALVAAVAIVPFVVFVFD
jgi:hypothetical protein